MTIKVCLAGATGWVGADLARAIHAADDLQLSGAVARSAAGRPLGEVLSIPGLDLTVRASAQEALDNTCDVFVEFSKPEAAKAHVLAGLAAGAHLVVGTSGLTDEDYAEIDAAAKKAQRGVLAAGNFALTAVLLLKFATMCQKELQEIFGKHFNTIGLSILE